MRRRPLTQPSSITSLIDVLFILVFASLVQVGRQRATDRDAEAAEAAQAEPRDAGVAAAPVDAAPPVARDQATLRAAALSTLAQDLALRPVVVARIAGDALVAIELDGRRIELGLPLVEKVPEPDVAIAYLGDRSAELRICRMAALRLGLPDLSGHLVVIAPDRPLAELTVALVAGLGRDAGRCLAEQGGVAVLVDPGAGAPEATP